jgi:hypothetical protein
MDVKYLVSEGDEDQIDSVTEVEIEQVALEIDVKRSELNRLGGCFESVTDELLILSQQLDLLINKYQQMLNIFKENKEPSA